MCHSDSACRVHLVKCQLVITCASCQSVNLSSRVHLVKCQLVITCAAQHVLFSTARVTQRKTCGVSRWRHTYTSYMSCPTPLVSKGPVPTMPNVLYARYVVTVSAPPSQPQQQIGERPAVRLYTDVFRPDVETLNTARYTYTPSYTFIPLPLPLCTSLDPRYTRNPTPPTSPHAPEQEDAASSVAALCCTLVALWERPGAHAQGLSRAAHTRISLLHRCCIPLARAHA
jgi:hypothetical protein